MRTPVATYRVQLNHAFTFRDLQRLTPYLHALGVSECYCSPILTARKGSPHGYDICDHSRLNPELGEQADLDALAGVLDAHGMGLLVDFVPNHMGIDPQTNVWWRDVLEHGPSSAYARYFDIDWRPVKEELRNKVLLAILGDQYGAVLERGELEIAHERGWPVLRYFDRVLPLNPQTVPLVLEPGIEALDAEADAVDLLALRAALAALDAMPLTTATDDASMEERRRATEQGRATLAALIQRSPALERHVERAVEAINGEAGVPASFDRLHELLEAQAYRLAYWRTAFDEINYRRFFDVNDLAGLRMENPAVFTATHRVLLDLIERRIVSGIRLDHPDGLFDPTAYCQALAAEIAARNPDPNRRIYVVVEKVLGRGERLRESWPVQGTTGYGCLNIINGLFVHPERLMTLRRHYREFTGNRTSPADAEYASKRLMMRTAMASELNVLTRALNRISETDRRARDFTLNSLRRALVEVIACFPVYRTYVSGHGAADEDVAIVDAAIAEAKRRNPVQEPSIFEFIRQVLLPPPTDAGAAVDRWRDRAVAFAHRFQQYTAPVVAKGLEDTAFYNDVLLLSTNEVGGDLQHRARTMAEFHEENQHRLARWPLEMTAGSTHDTKRGEDARARINVISELPDEWRSHLSRWTALNDSARTRLSTTVAPDRNDEWMYYQALVGAWPAEPMEAPVPEAAPDELIERMCEFMRKAMKEAKRHTSWVFENHPYEQAVMSFVNATLAGSTGRRFLASFVPFQRRLAWFGMLSSLAQLVIRVAAPGVPDVYQGTELWDFSLVDPDNRRPVDFTRRCRLLASLQSPDLGELLDDWPDGRAKLFTLSRALRFRRDHPDLMIHGEYEPLTTDEEPHLIAFSRRVRGEELIVVAPRFMAAMTKGVPQSPLGMERWRTASIPLPHRIANTTLVNVLTGETVEPLVHNGQPWLLAGAAFQSWPVALLHASQL